jgi:hypothetical protein
MSQRQDSRGYPGLVNDNGVNARSAAVASVGSAPAPDTVCEPLHLLLGQMAARRAKRNGTGPVSRSVPSALGSRERTDYGAAFAGATGSRLSSPAPLPFVSSRGRLPTLRSRPLLEAK